MIGNLLLTCWYLRTAILRVPRWPPLSWGGFFLEEKQIDLTLDYKFDQNIWYSQIIPNKWTAQTSTIASP